ncbi:hypothetical protein H6F86_05205 [Phormidium sp. FACHB-592]|uniref:Lipoprotein n=1 Tax=Stenomitos frigidus AS-A4 TaxID=2933935 RepID=A0ABV0KP34_9CYAN|nr:hypothetical protein [Phormidium sp. FACHB-592]MBD2073293.1 hypothetical protein [Phormidium sp. FACHB-592]
MSSKAVCLRAIATVVSLVLLSSCTRPPNNEATLDIKLYQTWQLQPGDTISDRRVLGGLGDISIALDGNDVYAPFDGRTQLNKHRCLMFSSPDVPAYLFRFCGLNDPQPRTLKQGDTIGNGDLLQFAALRKQPNGTWAIVEPAKAILESTLKKT